MRTLLVTGVSGAGKTTVARRLAAWGHRAVSADSDARLCGWADRDGRRVARPEHPDAAWLAVHEWRWDPARLDAMIAEAAGEDVASLWVCGRADNALQLVDRFDAVFLLEIDQRTIAARLRSEQRGNDFGRAGDTLAAVQAGYTAFVAGWRRHGAIVVDATGSVDTVAQELLLAAGFAALRPPRSAD